MHSAKAVLHRNTQCILSAVTKIDVQIALPLYGELSLLVMENSPPQHTFHPTPTMSANKQYQAQSQSS